MVLQNESIDEELEHFEDVVEETDDEPNTTSKKEEHVVGLVHGSDAAKSDSASSEDEDDTPASDSEDVSDGEELLVRNDSKDLEESKTLSEHNGQQRQVSSKSSLLPGGYNLRHREPSYWSVIYPKLILTSSNFHRVQHIYMGNKDYNTILWTETFWT